MTEVRQGQTWYVFSERGVEAYELSKHLSGPFGFYRPLKRPACFLILDADYRAPLISAGSHWVKVLCQNCYMVIDRQHFFGGPILEAEVFQRFAPDELL